MYTGAGISGILTTVLGPAAPIAIIIAGVLAIGAATMAYYNRNNTGIKMRFHWLLVPPFLILLTGIWPQ